MNLGHCAICAAPITDQQADESLVSDSPIYGADGELEEILLAHLKCAEFENERYRSWHHDSWCPSDCVWCSKATPQGPEPTDEEIAAYEGHAWHDARFDMRGEQMNPGCRFCWPQKETR